MIPKERAGLFSARLRLGAREQQREDLGNARQRQREDTASEKQGRKPCHNEQDGQKQKAGDPDEDIRFNVLPYIDYAT